MEHGVTSNKGSGEQQQQQQQQLRLPPGFRFHPTDEELITHYLSRKVLDASFIAVAIGEVDLNKCEPWDLPWRTKVGEREWYFFCVRDRKYPAGLRTNRATEAGYWKATGKDRGVYRGRALVGMKKTLVFYRGRAPKGEKTEWVMHEYRLEGAYPISNLPKSAAKNDWVVCRVIRKGGSGTGRKTTVGMTKMAMGSSCSHSGELGVHAPLPPLMDVHSCADVTCFSNIEGQEEYPKTVDDMPAAASNPRHDRTGGSLMQLLQGDIDYRPDQMMSNVSHETGITMGDVNPEISSGNARGVPSTFAAALYLQDCLWGY